MSDSPRQPEELREKSNCGVRATTCLLPRHRDPPHSAPGEAVTVTGRLEYASKLNQQNEIRIEPDGGGPAQRVRVPEGLMNDIVRPLWDERVMIRGTKRGEEILLVSIDPAE